MHRVVEECTVGGGLVDGKRAQAPCALGSQVRLLLLVLKK